MLATTSLLLVSACLPWQAWAAAAGQRYDKMCEASAAVALDAEHFIVAEDESNVLQIYRHGRSAPVRSPGIDLAGFLKTADKASDLEAGARIGDVIYWTSSHSLTSAGNSREWRHRLFATTVDRTVSPPTVRPMGTPYVRLVDDLLAADASWSLGLAKAAALKPEDPEGGLNIEGLAAGPDGSLLIGFRNPLNAGKALIVPILNPGSVVEGRPAKFGTPMLLALGGKGIRSMDAVSDGYLIVAGPIGDGEDFALHAWSGKATDAAKPLKVKLPAGFTPESLFVPPGAREVHLLSDDGSALVAGKVCKNLPKGQQRFRAMTISLPRDR